MFCGGRRLHDGIRSAEQFRRHREFRVEIGHSLFEERNCVRCASLRSNGEVPGTGIHSRIPPREDVEFQFGFLCGPGVADLPRYADDLGPLLKTYIHDVSDRVLAGKQKLRDRLATAGQLHEIVQWADEHSPVGCTVRQSPTIAVEIEVT